MRRRTQIASFMAAAVVGTLGFLALAGRRHSPPHPLPKSAAPLVSGPLAGVFVVLDPGHGGADPGTTAGPLSEAALTYRMAAELAVSLQAQGASVVFTVHSRCLNPALAISEPPPEQPADAVLAATGNALRLRHSPRPLWLRAAVAQDVWDRRRRVDPNAARDVFFVSLHFDQFHTDTVQGGLVCVDRRGGSVPPLARALAGQMEQVSLCRTEDFHGLRGVSGRRLGVLDPQYNPVPERVLLEIATLSNPQNAIEADDPVWRAEFVRRITQAITQTHQQAHQAEGRPALRQMSSIAAPTR